MLDVMNYKFKDLGIKDKSKKLSELMKKPVFDKKISYKFSRDSKGKTRLPEIRMPSMTLPRNDSVMRVFNVARLDRGVRMPKKNTGLDRIIYPRRAGDNGITRVKKQKGLSPWGDYDKDGLINMLDCEPRNRFKQGPEQNFDAQINPSDELREDYSTYAADNMPSTDVNPNWKFYSEDKDDNVVDAEYEVIDEAKDDDTKTMSEPATAKTSKFQAFLTKTRGSIEAARAQGREAALEQKTQRQIIEQKAREKARKDLERRRVKELSKVYAEKQSRTKSQQFFGGLSKGIDYVANAPGQVAKSVGRPLSGVGGFGINTSKLREQTYGLSGSQKIMAFLGRPVQQAPAQYQAYQQYQTPQAQPAQPMPQQASDTSGVVYSPYSKRKVTYVRGPYNKQR